MSKLVCTKVYSLGMSQPPAKATKADMVRRNVMARIAGGLEPHDQLPTERQLADQFDISRLTVRRALDQLEREGVVYRVQGSGTFVGQPSVTKSFELSSFSEDMRERGMRPGSHLLAAEILPAGGSVGFALGLSPTMPVVRIERIRTADAEPMALENCYLPESLVPGLADRLGNESLYRVLERDYALTLSHADQSVRATVLEPRAAELLQVPAFSPALLVIRTLYDARGRAIEHTESAYRADRYQYELKVQRRISR